MKKLLLALALLVSTTVFAEKKVGEYTSNGNIYQIEASYGNKGLTVLIQTLGKYKTDEVFLGVRGEQNIKFFKTSLIEFKAKFEEWADVAKKNNVTDFKKYYDITWPASELYWRGYDKWYSSYSSKSTLNPLFLVDENGASTAFFGKAKYWDNEYITQEWYMIFTSGAEIQSLIDALDTEKIIKQFTADANTDLLFK